MFFTHLKKWVLCVAVFLNCSLAQADFEALTELQGRGARISAVAVDLQSGKTLAALNATTRLTPASITKLVVAARALETWPANKVFPTRLFAATLPTNGTLKGDVVLSTDGDSSLDHLSLVGLASQLRSLGIRGIEGDVIASTAPFGFLNCETTDRCDALARSATAYNSPISGIGVDYGTWCVEVRPTKRSQAAAVSSCEGIPLPIAVRGKVTTVAAGGRSGVWITRRTTDGIDSLTLGGTIAEGGLITEYRAMGNPALGAAQLMRETLMANGIKVQGVAGVTSKAPSVQSVEVASVDSLPLGEQLGRMLRFSNNYVADMITMNIAAARGESIASLADAAHGLSQFVALGSARNSEVPQLYSGSGLTPENLISAKEMAGMLGREHRNAANFSTFYGALVVPRYAPYRYLRSGSDNWLDRVALKTGTLSVPHSVCAMSGYLRKQDGGFIAFSIMVNGGPALLRVPHNQCSNAIKADIDELLLRY